MSGEIKPLTSLRGVAALAVVMQHFSTTAQAHSQGWIPSLVPHGYMAVDLFFVLSGYIMVHSYGPDFASRGLGAFPSFLLRRAARILPLNTAVVLLVAAAGFASQALLGRNIVHAGHAPIYDTVSNLLLLQGFGVGTNLNGPSWSISMEFLAYLLFPLLLGLLAIRRAPVGAALMLLCWGVLAATAAQAHWSLDVQSIRVELVRCLTEFVIGMWTCRLAARPEIARRLASDWVAAAASLWVIASLLLRIDILAVLGFPPLIAALGENRGWFARRMGAGVPYFLGVISFSIYLLHNLFRPTELWLVQTLHPAPLAPPLALAFAVAGSLSVIPFAWAAYSLVERPGRSLGRSAPRLVAQLLQRARAAAVRPAL